MNHSLQALRLLTGLLGISTLLMSGVAGSAFAIAAPRTSAHSDTLISQRYQVPGGPIDFEEDDALEPTDDGFNAIYVNNRGSVLGTFINIPGAKIKVYANGQIEIEERDYTTEVDFRDDGSIREIGDVDFRFSGVGRISAIGDIDFRYSSSGRLREIADIEVRYFSSGRVKEIDTVEFDYERSGVIRTISEPQTEDGVWVVVVN